MEESLVQALAQCMDSNSEVRNAAESYLNSLKPQSGFTLLLLQISLNTFHSLPNRQLAAILLKNQIAKWKKCEIPDQDKNFIRNNLITCMKLSVPELVRLQYEEIALNITKSEYPWSGLNEQIETYLDSNDPDLIFAALTMLAKAAKNFEFVMTEKRSRLKLLISMFFNGLEKLFARLLTEDTSSALIYVNLILQIYWSCFYIELPPEQATEEVLDKWLAKFQVILNLDFDSEKPADHYAEELASKTPKLECKKWALQILFRFFSRYNDASGQLDSNKVISQVFTSKFAVPVLQSILSQVFRHSEVYIPGLIMNYSLKYINEAVKFTPTCEILTVMQGGTSGLVIPSLLTDVITPVLSLTAYDQELWQDNPVEFIRKGADLGKAYYSPLTAATDLLETLCKKGYLQQFLDYIMNSLNKPAQFLEKEALIYQVGSISSALLDSEHLSIKVQDMLSGHVFNELTSQCGYLRSRACWAYGKFAGFPFSNVEHQKAALEQLCKLLLDQDLPVKYEAALAVPKVLAWEISKSRVQGEISNLLKIYLDLINEIDSEEIIEALEEIVEQFSDEVAPFAVELVQQLCVTFGKLASREIADDNGDSAMAAVSILNTIVRLVETINDKNAEVIKVSFALAPVLEHCISKRGFEYMEEALKILSILLNSAEKGCLPHLYVLCKNVFSSLRTEDTYGIEKTEEMHPVFQNFIGKYSELVRNDLAEIVLFTSQLLTREPRLQKLACKLLTALLEHLRTETVPYLGQILPGLLGLLHTSESKRLKAYACQTILVAVWADVPNTPMLLHGTGHLQQVTEYSLSNLKQFKERTSRVQVLIGLCTLLPLIPNVLTTFTTTAAIEIFNKVLELAKLVQDDSDEEDGEEIDTNSKEFNDKCEEMYKKIQEKLEDSEDSKEMFENEVNEYCDSIFERFDYKGFIKETVEKCSQGLIADVMNSLEFSQKAFLNGFMNS